MDFPLLAPEINSALIYGGAGSGPWFAVAEAWDGLAAELGAAAASFGSTTSGLVGGAWQGAAASAMLAAAAPYAGWLQAAAAGAEGAATQVRAAAEAFESALTSAVPPAIVAANRAQFVSLVTSNWFGLNAPAIAAAEATYEQMWAQNVATMFGYYSGASSVAAAIPSFAALPALLDDAGTLVINFGLADVGRFNFGWGDVGQFNLGGG
ncbi:PPE family protein, partial [Mycobacterium gordonae]